MPIDRNWMYCRVRNNWITDEYIAGVKEFLDFAYENGPVNNGNIRCPCTKCKLRNYLGKDEVANHLLHNGFLRGYTKWVRHGEDDVPVQNNSSIQRESRNPYVDMVIDATRHQFDQEDRNKTEEPNPNAAKFYKLLADAEQPLWEGCKTHSTLSVISMLMNIKSEHNMSQSCFDRVISCLKSMLPPNTLPGNFYEAKKMMKALGLEYIKIDACPNDCMLYWKDDAGLNSCKVCGHKRYKERGISKRKKKNIPFKILRYLPITPRLQRLFMSKQTSKHMTWHKRACREEGELIHPSDGEAWKNFDSCYPEFANEARNVRLGLCTDGFNPFGNRSAPYSCWPVYVTPYNLPPTMCMKDAVLFLTLLIPGPRSPGNNLCVYLRPLIDELKTLWDDGTLTYDVSTRTNFVMKATLMWTIGDFPAYGMMSGWSTHGRLACPYCMEWSKAFTLKNGGKASFFDCHRQFLPQDHPYRDLAHVFKKGKVEHDPPPPRLTGDEVLSRLSCFQQINFGKASGNQKWPGYGVSHNWTKICSFWELPYWHNNLIRHNLDVMHIEQNVFNNVFNTVMDIKGKSKDNVKARRDVAEYCNRDKLHLYFDRRTNKTKMPKAKYVLSRNEKKAVCTWVRDLKLPDGYASNIAKSVNMNDLTLHGLKTHDCHVLMERLLPIAFRDLLPQPIWEVITELSIFFRDLCTTSLKIDHVKKMEANIAEILCKLEKFFPPGFFDSMEHLPIHLPYEAKVGGPVQYRWMFVFER